MVEQAVESVGLTDKMESRPNMLSGGECQRTAIARAIVHQPALVLADEPTANLDSKTGDQIITLMRDMNQSLGTTFVFSSHDPQVLDVADHVVKIIDGQVDADYRTCTL